MKEVKNVFDGVKKVHLTGIGGIGMSGIAEYLVKQGYEVTGSDITLSHITKRLVKLGVKISEGHKAENLADNTELLIYTSAVKEDNEELKKALSLKIKTVKRAEALGGIVNGKFLIAVAGTHGKTTTTAMIAKALIDDKFDPTVFAGGNLEFLDGGSSRIGKSDIAVVEADEYDRSFHTLNADIAIITNIDSDHLDIYKDLDDIKDSFRKFIMNSKKKLKIIACGDDDNIRAAFAENKNITYYGFKENNDHRIREVKFEKSKLSYWIDNDEVMLKVIGNHNILNSSAAYLTARELKIGNDAFNQSMKTFFGVKRRLELKYDNGVRIFDDYAHHPAEVKASLDAVRKNHSGRIITIFQPHLYSRTRDFYKEFGDSFKDTDILLLAKIYPAREEKIEGITSGLILDEYAKKGKEGKYIENREEIIKELEGMKQEGDVIIFMGAGDITLLSDKFVKIVKSKSREKIPL